MGAKIAYYRVSTADQSIDSQRQSLHEEFDHEFTDAGVSGSVLAVERPGFSSLLDFVRRGDTVYVYSLDRLGRDAIDVQKTVRSLLSKGVCIHVHGLGVITEGVGEVIVAVLAQIAAMERQRLAERTNAGREAARSSLNITGKTHRGKLSLGRPYAANKEAVRAWRSKYSASISATAQHFGISTASVSRYCAITHAT